jgi:hypothetical protein
MAEESQAIRGISWRETFPFTHLFRTFRVAIHPSKLLLGLTALIVLYIGGNFLDTIWPVKHRAVQNETQLFEHRDEPNHDFPVERRASRRLIEERYASLLQELKIVPDRTAALGDAENGKRFGEVKDKLIAERNKRVQDLDTAYNADKNKAKALTDANLRDKTIEDTDRAYNQARMAIYQATSDTLNDAALIKNTGIFGEFFNYERLQFNSIIAAVKRLSWVEGYHAIERFFAVGPVWLLTQHPIYFFLFLILFTATWAVFGGAIARIAAVHVARDEKLSIRAALRFSTGKFLSFLFAPIIPLLIIAGLGIVTMLLALVVNIPFFGPIIAGIFFFILLAIGFVMALVLVGTVGGFNLMYPTIAVEGSDSFDAISRSFSYLYARPWRLAFYTIVSVAYGAITYTFLKLFIALMLKMIHTFAGYGVFRHADNMRPLWDMLWTGPGRYSQLSYELDTLTLGPGETLGAYLIALWVYLVISILGAYAISFYFSANTIIYYLMRNEVDATDMDDVFVEQQDDELMESPAPPAPVAPAAPAPAVATNPAPEAPAPEPTLDSNPNPDTPPPAASA